MEICNLTNLPIQHNERVIRVQLSESLSTYPLYNAMRKYFGDLALDKYNGIGVVNLAAWELFELAHPEIRPRLRNFHTYTDILKSQTPFTSLSDANKIAMGQDVYADNMMYIISKFFTTIAVGKFKSFTEMGDGYRFGNWDGDYNDITISNVLYFKLSAVERLGFIFDTSNDFEFVRVLYEFIKYCTKYDIDFCRPNMPRVKMLDGSIIKNQHNVLMELISILSERKDCDELLTKFIHLMVFMEKMV